MLAETLSTQLTDQSSFSFRVAMNQEDDRKLERIQCPDSPTTLIFKGRVFQSQGLCHARPMLTLKLRCTATLKS